MKKFYSLTKKRGVLFILLCALIIVLQFIFTGSLLAEQQMTTQAGDELSSVVGVVDRTRFVRQKFRFQRKVTLTEISFSLGAYQRDDVGDIFNVKLLDNKSTLLFEADIPVDDLTQNTTAHVTLESPVTLKKGKTYRINLCCRSQEGGFKNLPTLNTTNRTDPNTVLLTDGTSVKSKCLTVSYTYRYRQIFPFLLLLVEFVLLFVLCFAHVKADRLPETLCAKKDEETETPGEKKKKRKIKAVFLSAGKRLFSERSAKYTRTVVFLIHPLVLFFLMEAMAGNLSNVGPNVWVFTWVLLFAFSLLLYAIIGNRQIAALILDCIVFLAGAANVVLLAVRGTPLLPADLFALNTAAQVAGTYTVSFTPAQFVVIPTFLLWCVFLVRLSDKKQKRKLSAKIFFRISPAVICFLVVGILYYTPVLEKCKITDNVWNKAASCRTNGFTMNFFINLHYLRVKKPAGYTQAKVEEILDQMDEEGTYLPADAGTSDTQAGKTSTSDAAVSSEPSSGDFLTNADFTTNTALSGQLPNIILIMNESLADYDLIGQTNFNSDPLAYLHSMEENTITGLDYVSVYGAGTSNSEFEAMTGNSMKFFPSGSNVYQQFMHETTYSLSYYLKNLGYRTVAVHPSSGLNWNRINTYNSMHFDRFVTIEEFENPEYVRYISDKESYKKVIELYEENQGDAPFFAFDMTIQNHGGYLTETDWEDPVTVVGADYPQAKEYLSATKVSDQAFAYLVDYFSDVDEPTIICMFGDHQPSIETEFYEELIGKKQSAWDLTDIQKQFVTPFVIWANYDIDEGKDVVISNNYIENLLLKEAGINLPKYNQYVEIVSQSIPAMNVNGYMDVAGTWHAYGNDETESIQKLLDNYEILQYGYYSDKDKDEMGKLFQTEVGQDG